MAYPSDPIPEEMISEPSVASQLGYSRSKWVAEHICDAANSKTALRGRVSIFRVGQLAGDSHKGVWNTKEAWPMMLSLVKLTRTLPDLVGETLDWLPVDIAAMALMQGMSCQYENALAKGHSAAGGGDDDVGESHEGDEIKTADGGPNDTESQTASGHGAKTRASGSVTDVLHLLNARENPKWIQMLHWMQKEANFEIIRASEWVEQLERLEQDGRTHPAFNLLGLWQSLKEDPNDKGKKNTFATARTAERIPAIRDVGPIDEQYFLKIWRWIDANM